ncbi:MAG TPA: glycosyltransferase, partial [Chthonomonadaceae bacterium]|nr:glycosyltransferase [Chthonomonadaceae bacterium]
MPSKTTSRSVPDWDQAPQFGRRDTLLPALRRLHQLCEEPSCIVEIGSARDERPEACLGDGWSTRAWGWFALQTGGRAYTVDIEPEAIAACKRLTAEFAEAITYTTSDSLEFLRTWSLAERGTIDLLYLDSLDYIDTLRSEHRHLKEAAAALPSLSPRCLVLLDDTYPSGQLPSEGDADLTGKGALVAPFLLEQGFRLEWVAGGEALLSRGAEEIPPVIGLHGKTEAAITQRLQEHTHRKWRQMSALCRIGRDYRAFETTPEATEVLAMVARLCGKDGSACEVGAESAFGTVWLALQGIQATGLLGDPALLERARQASYWIGGEAQFLAGDPLVLYHEEAARYRVIHHRDLAAALPTPWLRSVLAQQVALADWVVFSVPSEFAPESDEMDALGCRLMPLEAWRHLLTPFEVADLRLYGASQPGGQDRIRVILKGQPLTPALRRLMSVGPEPYPFGISVIVHTRNEAHQLAECLRTVLSWADEIIICDMGSTDATLQIAHQFTDQIIQHTPIPNFDRSRNVSAMRARYRFLFYLDADERVPEGLGPRLRHLLATQGHLFEAMALPFKHHFAGKPMQSLAPYKAPSIYKNGTFFYNARPHQGARIEGRVVYFSADDPNNYLPHYSYTDISHYLKKMDHYTSTEAANLFHDGRTFHWQEMIVHAVRDMRAYYDGGGAFRDGPHGLLYSLLSGFYRIAQHGKLWESQYKAETQEGKKPGREESVVPQSLEEVLEFALAVARERPAQEPPAAASSTETLPAEVAWYGPHNSPSGYGEECRHFVLAADQAGVQIAARSLSWGDDQKLLEGAEAARLQELEGRDIKPGFVQIIQNFPQGFVRHPQAGRAIGRTMFETDRLPESWVQACNRMDAIWVPSEFNKETFRLAGVAAEKLVVVPGCFDPVPYLKKENLTTEVTEEHRGNTEKNKEREEGKFTFLSVFDWTRHKGWDVLLKAFVQAFEGRDDVQLVLKVWSSQGYTPQNIRDQAAELLRMEGHDLDADVRIRFVFERLTQRELIALYQACDAFVLPSRGEGWGRPYMEAMACGLPTIGTNWSGNTAFMTPENSYLLDYRLVPVPEIGWREIPTYQGHRWAEPDADHLRNTLRAVVDNREEGRRKGALARDEVCARFSREAVGKRMAEEILHHREHRGSQRKTTEKSIEHDPQINADYHRLQTTEENNQDGKKPENQEGNTGEASSLRPCSPLPLRER